MQTHGKQYVVVGMVAKKKVMAEAVGGDVIKAVDRENGSQSAKLYGDSTLPDKITT